MSEQEKKETQNNSESNRLGNYEKPVFDGPQSDEIVRPLPDLNTENAGE